MHVKIDEVIFDIEMRHDGVLKCVPIVKYIGGTVNVLANIYSDFFEWLDLEMLSGS